MSKKEPKERIRRRVREFRKRRHEALMQPNAYIFALRTFLSDRGLDREWVDASEVYNSTAFLNVFLTFGQFISAIRGTKKFPGVKSIESAPAWVNGSLVVLVRRAHIPTRRKH